MHRRQILVAAGAGLLGPLAGSAFLGRAAHPRGGSDAWLAGLPLIEMAAARKRMLNPAAVVQEAGLNAFSHTRDLVRSGDHAVTTTPSSPAPSWT